MMLRASRREFLHHLGLTAGALACATLPAPAQATLENLEVRKATPVIGEYEVNVDFIHRGPGFGRRVAITFDDGPSPGNTERVLAALQQRKIKATFFLIGRNVKAYPAIAQQIAAEGHELANHSYTHPALGKLSAEKVRWELNTCQQAIQEHVGIFPCWFRPPYGSFRKDQGTLASGHQLGVTYWSVDPQDWRKPGVSIVIDRVLSSARPGSIILLHDIHKPTVEAVPAILDGLLERGYEFATISGFLGHPYAAL